MPVLVVIGVDKGNAERPSVLHRAEPFGERRAVLQGLELGFGVRIVVGDVRAECDRTIPRSTSSCATGLELVAEGHQGLLEVLAGARDGPQDLGRVVVVGQWGEAVAVGAQHVGQQVGVGGVGLGTEAP
jgi:hypothetical protein